MARDVAISCLSATIIIHGHASDGEASNAADASWQLPLGMASTPAHKFGQKLKLFITRPLFVRGEVCDDGHTYSKALMAADALLELKAWSVLASCIGDNQSITCIERCSYSALKKSKLSSCFLKNLGYRLLRTRKQDTGSFTTTNRNGNNDQLLERTDRPLSGHRNATTADCPTSLLQDRLPTRSYEDVLP